jgi:hypothetical protein
VVMHLLLRRLVVLLVALAFISGGVAGAATPVPAAAEPCPHEHGGMPRHTGDMPGSAQHQQDHGSRACLQCCCLGTCVSVPNLSTALIIAPVIVTSVVYWDSSRTAAGRSFRPNRGPPRPLV